MMIPVGSVAQGLFLDPMIPCSLSLLSMGCKKRERGLQQPWDREDLLPSLSSTPAVSGTQELEEGS